MTLQEKLKTMGACSPAVEWVGARDLKAAWVECERADWMLWFAEEVGVPRPSMTLAACACARTALQYVSAGEDRPRLAIEAAERWAKHPTERNRKAAEAAAWAATHKQMSVLVRKIIPYQIIKKYAEKKP